MQLKTIAMIKKNIKYFILFISINSYSQNIENIIKSDTIYFYFDYSKQLEKKMSFEENSNTEDSSYVYTYNDFIKGRNMECIKLKKGKNLSTKKKDLNNNSDVKIITNIFFKDPNSPIIYPIDLENGLIRKILDHEIKLDDKVIYIIDEIEKWGKDYMAKEVYLTMGSKLININYASNNNIDYKSLKDKDTVYFYFDYSKNLEKKTYNINPKEKSTVYYFYENNPKTAIFRRKFLLHSKLYLSSFERDIDKKADVKIISISFLRKNKEIIIYPKDLEGQKMEKVISEINAVVYVIDTSEKKGNKFIAREVIFNYGTFIEL